MVMHYCDRCGKEMVGPTTDVYRFRIHWPYESNGDRRTSGRFDSMVDLCDECYDSFVEWFDANFTRVTDGEEADHEER